MAIRDSFTEQARYPLQLWGTTFMPYPRSCRSRSSTSNIERSAVATITLSLPNYSHTSFIVVKVKNYHCKWLHVSIRLVSITAR